MRHCFGAFGVSEEVSEESRHWLRDGFGYFEVFREVAGGSGEFLGFFFRHFAATHEEYEEIMHLFVCLRWDFGGRRRAGGEGGTAHLDS